ncbi:ricin-type beta-trefoil lectin domain protein [Dactylosporangium sp. CA-233914]|uniref:ricin-type beta-trefoil lectin domain protein n=1 Tax=Dactylosporangium sp. CA-233914 TaxID=3239934 RepID=UPI003D8E5B65
MSVAGDGENAVDSGALPPAAGHPAHHRVPPTAAASAGVLPAPFKPAKPVIPAIPHQRRPDGPTAVATASIPVVEPAAEESDPSPVATLAGEARADAADETRNLEFIVTLPGTDSYPVVTNDPELEAPSRELEVASEEPVETVEGELLPAGATIPPDDSPTVADYKAPALAIVTDYVHEDAEDYRGSRRRVMPWRRYPVGAVAVAVLILLITGAVVFQAVDNDGPGGTSDGLPGRVPGVDGPRGAGPVPAGDPGSPSAGEEESETAAANPATTHPRTATTAPSTQPSAVASAAPSATKATTSPPPPPPPAQPTTGRLVGAQSHRCMEYLDARNNYRVIIGNCDSGNNQVWRVQGNATTGATLLSDRGWCLDVQNAGTGNGNAIQAYGCNGTVAQVWVRRADNTWMNPNSKRCLTAANNGTGAGTPIVLWDCTAAPSQVWTMQ